MRLTVNVERLPGVNRWTTGGIVEP